MNNVWFVMLVFMCVLVGFSPVVSSTVVSESIMHEIDTEPLFSLTIEEDTPIVVLGAISELMNLSDTFSYSAKSSFPFVVDPEISENGLLSLNIGSNMNGRGRITLFADSKNYRVEKFFYVTVEPRDDIFEKRSFPEQLTIKEDASPIEYFLDTILIGDSVKEFTVKSTDSTLIIPRITGDNHLVIKPNPDSFGNCSVVISSVYGNSEFVDSIAITVTSVSEKSFRIGDIPDVTFHLNEILNGTGKDFVFPLDSGYIQNESGNELTFSLVSSDNVLLKNPPYLLGDTVLCIPYSSDLVIGSIEYTLVTEGPDNIGSQDRFSLHWDLDGRTYKPVFFSIPQDSFSYSDHITSFRDTIGSLDELTSYAFLSGIDADSGANNYDLSFRSTDSTIAVPVIENGFLIFYMRNRSGECQINGQVIDARGGVDYCTLSVLNSSAGYLFDSLGIDTIPEDSGTILLDFQNYKSMNSSFLGNQTIAPWNNGVKAVSFTVDNDRNYGLISIAENFYGSCLWVVEVVEDSITVIDTFKLVIDPVWDLPELTDTLPELKIDLGDGSSDHVDSFAITLDDYFGSVEKTTLTYFLSIDEVIDTSRDSNYVYASIIDDSLWIHARGFNNDSNEITISAMDTNSYRFDTTVSLSMVVHNRKPSQIGVQYDIDTEEEFGIKYIQHPRRIFACGSYGEPVYSITLSDSTIFSFGKEENSWIEILSVPNKHGTVEVISAAVWPDTALYDTSVVIVRNTLDPFGWNPPIEYIDFWGSLKSQVINLEAQFESDYPLNWSVDNLNEDLVEASIDYKHNLIVKPKISALTADAKLVLHASDTVVHNYAFDTVLVRLHALPQGPKSNSAFFQCPPETTIVLDLNNDLDWNSSETLRFSIESTTIGSISLNHGLLTVTNVGTGGEVTIVAIGEQGISAEQIITFYGIETWVKPEPLEFEEVVTLSDSNVLDSILFEKLFIADSTTTFSVQTADSLLVQTFVDDSSVVVCSRSSREGNTTITIVAKGMGGSDSIQVPVTVTERTANLNIELPDTLYVYENSFGTRLDLESLFFRGSNCTFSIVKTDSSVQDIEKVNGEIDNAHYLHVYPKPDSVGVARLSLQSVVGFDTSVYTFPINIYEVWQEPQRVMSLNDIVLMEDGGDSSFSLAGVFSGDSDFRYDVSVKSIPSSIDSTEQFCTVSINAVAKRATVSVKENRYGISQCIVTATDRMGGSVSDTFTVTITSIPEPPQRASVLSDVVMNEDDPRKKVGSLDSCFINDWGELDPLHLTVKTNNRAVVIPDLDSNGLVYIRPRPNAYGKAYVIVTGSNQNGMVSDTFSVTVNGVTEVSEPLGLSQLKLPGNGRDTLIDLDSLLKSDRPVSYSVELSDSLTVTALQTGIGYLKLHGTCDSITKSEMVIKTLDDKGNRRVDTVAITVVPAYPVMEQRGFLPNIEFLQTDTLLTFYLDSLIRYGEISFNQLDSSVAGVIFSIVDTAITCVPDSTVAYSVSNQFEVVYTSPVYFDTLKDTIETHLSVPSTFTTHIDTIPNFYLDEDSDSIIVVDLSDYYVNKKSSSLDSFSVSYDSSKIASIESVGESLFCSIRKNSTGLANVIVTVYDTLSGSEYIDVEIGLDTVSVETASQESRTEYVSTFSQRDTFAICISSSYDWGEVETPLPDMTIFESDEGVLLDLKAAFAFDRAVTYEVMTEGDSTATAYWGKYDYLVLNSLRRGVGETSVIVTASSSVYTVSDTFTITVVADSSAPISIVQSDFSLEYTEDFSDDTLNLKTLFFSRAPIDFSIVPGTYDTLVSAAIIEDSLLVLSSLNNLYGMTSMDIAALNTFGDSVETSIDLNVHPVNDSPEISYTTNSFYPIWEELSLSPDWSDSDDSLLLWEIHDAPVGVTLDQQSGELNWFPDGAHFGHISFSIIGWDSWGASDTESITFELTKDMSESDTALVDSRSNTVFFSPTIIAPSHDGTWLYLPYGWKLRTCSIRDIVGNLLFNMAFSVPDFEGKTLFWDGRNLTGRRVAGTVISTIEVIDPDGMVYHFQHTIGVQQ